MTRNILAILAIAGAVTMGGAGAGLAHSEGHDGGGHGHGAVGSCDGVGMMGAGMMPMMMQRGMMGPGMMGRSMMGYGMMGQMGAGAGGMMRYLDTNNDGRVTSDEAGAELKKLMGDYDANGDGTLSIAEFEALHSALIRRTMVRRFQYLDTNGDGQVTAEEMTAPARQIERMNQFREQMMQGAPGAMQPYHHGGGYDGDDMPMHQGGMMGRGMMNGD